MAPRNTLTYRLRLLKQWRKYHNWGDWLPDLYMPAKKRPKPITTAEAGRLRWANMTPADRSEFMRQVALRSWAKRKRKNSKRKP